MINSSVFEITGDHIARLNDTDLRELIGLLCEADYRSSGLRLSGIQYGGHQNARDGGIDVIVEDDFDPPEKSFIPRKVTGFQVKTPKMFPSDIISEMKPGGRLRPKIIKLIKQRGAYIIVSSGSSVTETAYDDRIAAMREAVATENNHEDLHIDFFDQKRIATWVRTHPSMVLWVRQRIGREIPGWQPYGNWAKAPGGENEPYILDETLRLFDATSSENAELTVEEGITSLRQKLSRSGTSIRLVGLSGVGKTRLVQALFDDRVGQEALNPLLAVYTDVSDEPQPDPRSFAEQLFLRAERIIFIVDNCPPELHRKLTEICIQSGSKISLLTVEYDVKEDIPEETEVIRLGTPSQKVITELISIRYPFISQSDVRVIAEFSDGNARIAIALASTLEKGDSLTNLKDGYLFERLFWQRNESDENLLQAAEAFSLLYSFEGTKTGPDSELYLLGSLIGKSADKLYRYTRDLRERDLIQSRSNWRAVLPQAIANRLAKRALEAVPKDRLVKTIIRSDNDRLIKSFTHRLSYLHDSEMAKEIASDWLSLEGWIGERIIDLNDFEIQILAYLAPVCPEQTLRLLEKAAADQKRGEWFTSRENPNFFQFVRLLRRLAYEADTFERSATLLARFAVSEDEKENVNSIRNHFTSLFSIKLAGTHATLEDRFKFVKELLHSDDIEEQNLGLQALNAALKAQRFLLISDVSFGSRSRDYGYRPKNKDVVPWFEAFIKLCTSHILSDKPTAKKAKVILAKKIRELWMHARIYDLIESYTRRILEDQSWNEAWIAVGEILHFDSKHMSKEIIERLYALREELKPKSLESLARAYVLDDQHYFLDLENENTDDLNPSKDPWERLQEKTIEIGFNVAKEEVILGRLLPELVSTSSSNLYALGVGLARGSMDIKALWKKICDEYVHTEKEKRQTDLLLGFLSQCAKDAPETHRDILNEIVEDEILGEIYPIFESAVPIDRHGLQRLYKSLEINRFPIERYTLINRAHMSIVDDFADFLAELLKRKGGFIPVANILLFRFSNRKDPSLHSDKLLSVARKTLIVYDFSTIGKHQQALDHILRSIAEVCLGTKHQGHITSNICINIRNALSEDYISGASIQTYMELLLQNYPKIFLDVFLDYSEGRDTIYFHNFHSMFYKEVNPLSKVSDAILIGWCEKDPENRFEKLSDIMQPFVEAEDTSRLVWREILYYIFENVKELEQILENIGSSIRPRSYMGSYADLLQTRIPLFEQIKDHANETIRTWAQSQLLSLQKEIREHQDFEKSINRRALHSFE